MKGKSAVSADAELVKTVADLQKMRAICQKELWKANRVATQQQVTQSMPEEPKSRHNPFSLFSMDREASLLDAQADADGNLVVLKAHLAEYDGDPNFTKSS